jgi:hypothetical protein
LELLELLALLALLALLELFEVCELLERSAPPHVTTAKSARPNGNPRRETCGGGVG